MTRLAFLLLSAFLTSSLLAVDDRYLLEEELPDLPINTFKVSYDSEKPYSDSVRKAFVMVTGVMSVGDAISWLAQNRFIKSAECDKQMCEVSWEEGKSGEASGSVDGGVVGGSLSGNGSNTRKYSVKVPCHMLFETISRLDSRKQIVKPAPKAD